jgi:hypothetical protein
MNSTFQLKSDFNRSFNRSVLHAKSHSGGLGELGPQEAGGNAFSLTLCQSKRR